MPVTTPMAKLIRNNLKSLSLALDNPDILRIHRSYMINRPNINSVTRDGRKMVIHMNHIQDQSIPVSSSYKTDLETALGNLRKA